MVGATSGGFNGGGGGGKGLYPIINGGARRGYGGHGSRTTKIPLLVEEFLEFAAGAVAVWVLWP
jgi:hypothetical protein